MIHNISIRDAEEKDAKILTSIAISSKKHWGYPEEWFELWDGEFDISADYIKGNKVIVAVFQDAIAGFGVVTIMGKYTELAHLWILPEHMNNGIGKILMQSVLTHCRENGVDELKIISDPNATEFYRKMGAQQIGYVKAKPEPRQLPLLSIKI